MSSVDAATLNPSLTFKAGWQGATVVAAWVAVALLISYWPNAVRNWPMTQGLANVCVAVAALFILLSLLGLRFSRLGQRLQKAGPWLIALPVLLGVWELLTAKLALLPVPFFAPPQALLAVYVEDYARLADSLLHSALLLGSGVALGAATGFVAGVSIGWSTRIGYWLHPVLR
ncbi:ABC transporter permease, partial [Pseudomonas edaphica]